MADEVRTFHPRQIAFGGENVQEVSAPLARRKQQMRENSTETARMGPQDSVQLVYKWLNSMVYGRYNYSTSWGL